MPKPIHRYRNQLSPQKILNSAESSENFDLFKSLHLLLALKFNT